MPYVPIYIRVYAQVNCSDQVRRARHTQVRAKNRNGRLDRYIKHKEPEPASDKVKFCCCDNIHTYVVDGKPYHRLLTTW